MKATAPTIVLDGRSLGIGTLEQLAEGRATLAIDNETWSQIERGRAVVDRLLAEGGEAYGVTTGVGSQKDFAVSAREAQGFNRRLLVAHATIGSDEAHRPQVVRAALALLLNGFASGRSGVRAELVQALLALFADHECPTAASGCSVGASDLVPLAQIALRLIGVPSVLAGEAPPVAAAPLALAEKEALSLMGSNAFSLGRGALVLADARRLLRSMCEAACLSLEGFRGNVSIVDPAVGAAHPQPGQLRVAAEMRERLRDSALLAPGAARLLQDPLSFRCAPQILGALDSALDWVWQGWERELNATQDNPLVDPREDRLLSHGNMDSTLLTIGLDTLRAAIAAAIEAATQRLHKLHWPAFSGLPVGLAQEGGAAGGVQFLNLGHLAAAASAEVRALARPVAQAYSAQLADGVEDYAAPLPLAVQETERQLTAAWRVLTIEVAVACWAIARRGLAPDQIGCGLRETVDLVSAMLPRGREGERVFDLRPLTGLLRTRARRG